MVNNGKTILFVFLTILLEGCSTYAPVDSGLFYTGYREEKLSDNEWGVWFHGGPYDSFDHIEPMWHRRAEELCGSKNYEASPEQTYEYVTAPSLNYYGNETHRYPVVVGKVTCRKNGG